MLVVFFFLQSLNENDQAKRISAEDQVYRFRFASQIISIGNYHPLTKRIWYGPELLARRPCS
jgi:hypothetical protein